MSNMIRLVFGIVIAAGAGIGNYVWLNAVQNQHPEFLRASTAIKPGDEIKSSMLDRVRVPGDESELKKTYIPADSKSLVVGTPAVRSYKEGEMLMQADMSDTLPRWKALGPFRLLSVGERIRNGSRYSDGSGGDTVTIAARVDSNGKYDKKTERLLDIVASRSKAIQIVAIQLEPDTEPRTAESNSFGDEVLGDELYDETPLALNDGERGIIVPLKDVVSIPEVLVRGSEISFVVSWFED